MAKSSITCKPIIERDAVRAARRMPSWKYRPRTLAQVQARIDAANDDDAAPRKRAHFGLGKFFCDPANLPYIAAALGVKPNAWHRALLPKALRERYGNRGCLMVHDKEHGSWIRYCVMGVGRKRRGKKHYFRPHRIFASESLGISPVASLSKVAAWQLDALLLAKAGRLLMPKRLFEVPDARAAKAFGFEKPHEQESKVWDEARRARKVHGELDLSPLFDMPQAPPFVWKAAVAMLDRIAEARDLLLMHQGTHLVHRLELEDGEHAGLIQIDNSWLAHLCRRELIVLARIFGRPHPTAQDLEELAGELRRRLYRAGMLLREHVEQRRWMFGPKAVSAGMTKEELMLFNPQPQIIKAL